MNPQGQQPYGTQPNPYGYRQPPPPIRPQRDMTQPFAIAIGIVLVLFMVVGEIIRHVAVHPNGHSSTVVGPTVALEAGVSWHKVDLPGGDGTRTLWVYLPSSAGSSKVPCIFIAPAGSSCLDGMPLADGDRAEHLPYVRAGYAVVAYSLDGAFTDRTSAASEVHAIETFRDAHAGLDNERAAVDYAIANIPQIDRTKLYAAGHSSAGTMALLAAENDRRLIGCIAYAPRCDVGSELDKDEREALTSRIDGFDQFLSSCSPSTRATSIRCPVFLFHADDDQRVPTDDVIGFEGKLKTADSSVTYCHVATGGHYDSMINDGIPQAINWLKGGMQTTADLPVTSTVPASTDGADGGVSTDSGPPDSSGGGDSGGQ
jgi:dipeptidyl aminopeptidase/acylaminoacyl peptidase